jgi:sarcosine oxidase
VVEVNRRSVLIGSSFTGALMLTKASRATGPAIIRGLPDFVVVGAGAFGGWAALCLRERGAKVVLVDLYGPGNARASSGDESRLIRASYGAHVAYSELAVRAVRLWLSRQDEMGRGMIYLNGSLRVLSEEKIAAQKPIFDKLGLKYQILTSGEVHQRWPQVSYDDVAQVFYEPQSGIVKARESMIGVAELFRRKGGLVRIGRAQITGGRGRKLESLIVDGAALSGGSFLVACGPWLPKVVPRVMGDKVYTPRVELAYIGSPPDDRRYRWELCPNLTDDDGFTAADLDYGTKVGAKIPEQNGPSIDPDRLERIPTIKHLNAAKAYVEKRLPGLAGQPVVATRICQAEFSNNGHYIIDRHPDYENVLLAGGGSGHGFKMGPVLGEYLADRLALGKVDPILDPLFSLASHGPVGENNTYI